MTLGLFQAPDGIQLVGNLNWQMLHIEGSTAKHIRTLASERSASHCALVMGPDGHTVSDSGKARSAKRRTIGLLINTDGLKVPANTHSLAALFAVWASSHATALLHVKIAEDSYAVIGVFNGLPVLDKIVRSESDAVETAKRFLNGHKDVHVSVFSDDGHSFPNRIALDNLLADIVSNNDKSTLLYKVPPNYLAWVAIILLVAGSVAGYYVYAEHSKAKKLQDELLRQAAANPETLYLEALSSARSRAGVTRETLSAAFEQALSLNLRVGGWAIRRVECDLEAGCRGTYQRETGTFESLVKLNSGFSLIPTPDLRLNYAAMTWSQPLNIAPLEKTNELTFGAFAQGFAASQLQDWVDAKLSIQVAPPAIWPQVPGVQANTRIAGAVGQGKFEIGGVQLPQAREVILTAPKNVVWSGFQIEVGDLKQEAMSQAKVKLTGNYYVQYQ